MLDVVQILMWSVTYVLVIVSGIQNREEKKVAMPYFAGILNFAWEACALQQYQGFWGHIFWLGLDMGIVYFGFSYLPSLKCKALYAGAIYVAILALSYLFALPNGMLISVFVIDLILALNYLTARKKLSDKQKLPIAVTKLLGDLFAGIYYAPKLPAVAVMTILVLICNLLYVYLCYQEKMMKEKKIA